MDIILTSVYSHVGAHLPASDRIRLGQVCKLLRAAQHDWFAQDGTAAQKKWQMVPPTLQRAMDKPLWVGTIFRRSKRYVPLSRQVDEQLDGIVAFYRDRCGVDVSERTGEWPCKGYGNIPTLQTATMGAGRPPWATMSHPIMRPAYPADYLFCRVLDASAGEIKVLTLSFGDRAFVKHLNPTLARAPTPGLAELLATGHYKSYRLL